MTDFCTTQYWNGTDWQTPLYITSSLVGQLITLCICEPGWGILWSEVRGQGLLSTTLDGGFSKTPLSECRLQVTHFFRHLLGCWANISTADVEVLGYLSGWVTIHLLHGTAHYIYYYWYGILPQRSYATTLNTAHSRAQLYNLSLSYKHLC